MFRVGSCLRPRGHCDRLYYSLVDKNCENIKRRIPKWNKNFWEELIACFPLIHFPHRKRRLKSFPRELFTEPLPSNSRATHMQTRRHRERIHDIRRWDGLRCHGMHTTIHKIGSGIQKLIGGIHRQYGDRTSRLFLQITHNCDLGGKFLFRSFEYFIWQII
jgi:hypothetical protein